MQNVVKKHADEKWFSCGCREWRYVPDMDRKERRPEDTYVVHDCPKLLVCREPKTLTRTFVWKPANDATKN